MLAASKVDGSQVGTPTWSPDGNRIAYIRTSWAYNARTSYVEVNEWRSATAETLFSDGRLHLRCVGCRMAVSSTLLATRKPQAGKTQASGWCRYNNPGKFPGPRNASHQDMAGFHKLQGAPMGKY